MKKETGQQIDGAAQGAEGWTHAKSTGIFKRVHLSLERGEGREKEKERNINVRNIDWLPPIGSPDGTEPVAHVYALTWDRTGDPSLCKDNAQPNEPHGSRDKGN